MSHNLLLKSLAYREAGLSLLTMAIRMKKRLPNLLLNAAVVLLRPRLRSSSSTWSITFTNTISDLAIREKPKPRPRGRPPKTAAVVEDSDEEGANEAQAEAPENDDQEEEPVYVIANYISVTMPAHCRTVLEKLLLEAVSHRTGLKTSSRAPESSESLYT